MTAHNNGDLNEIDEGTEVLKHLADDIQAEREHGASHFAVPADEPDYVEDEASIERSEAETFEGDSTDDGPIVPIRPV